jgi:hypothetical protein
MYKIFGLMIAGVSFLLSSTSCAQPKREAGTKEKVADAYHIGQFKNAKSLAFTFNVRRDTTVSSRNWLWDIPGNIVTYNKGEETVTYRRDTINSEKMKKIDGTFINDQYWLLFPYHLVWDSGMVVSETPNQLSPIGQKETTMLTVQYGDAGGYTPGDAYDLFIDENYMITEWNFRKKGAAKPSLTTTWAEPVTVGGMTFATNHTNADSSFQLYFTNVRVK